MKVTTLELPKSLADRQAAERWEANLVSLAANQPDVAALFDMPPEGPWLFARDGSLTSRDVSGHWRAGCSLPARAGRAMLKKLDVRGVVGCLLAPTHAGHIAAALDKLTPRQAVVVIAPDADELAVALACGDFAADILRHRLWFAVGIGWRETLRQLYDEHPGLPTPSQFIRLPITADEVATPLIRAAETIFNDINATRSAAATQIPRAVKHGWLLIAPSHFRLWDDAGHALIEALAPSPLYPGARVGVRGSSVGRSASKFEEPLTPNPSPLGTGARGTVLHLDPDDPSQSAAMSLAYAAARCERLIVPNRVRAELPDVLSADVGVTTWITEPRVPAYDSRYPQDAVMITDPAWRALAQKAGWPADRIKVADWPAVTLPASAGGVAMICDTASIETPTRELELSSHHVLWELIRGDLLADPFSLRGDCEGFIERRRVKLGVAAEGFDRDLFTARLVLPAYRQAIATRLIRAKVPVQLFGRGWGELPEFRNAYAGAIETREALHAAASAATLIYPWPSRHRHPIDALGRAVIGPWETEAAMLRDVRKPLLSATAAPKLSRGSIGLMP